MADGSGYMQTCFSPNPENTRLLRDAFGRFATGVTVVTAASKDGPVGITVNSFSSLSLDPALLLWSLSKQSRRYPFFADAKHFAVHILSEKQTNICHGFAQDIHAFDDLDVDMSKNGVPLLSGCLARLECKLHASYPGGDHQIIVGEITDVAMGQGNSLAFYDGAFGSVHTAEDT